MRLLYIFPHPDDESFGPAGAMRRQTLDGHEVHLLTLTRGGATQVRHELDLSIDAMGEVRLHELEAATAVLGLAGLHVTDLPDSGLKEMDPRAIEAVIRTEIEALQPAIVVSYPVHGISGFHDHLVCHAVVKRVFLEMKDQGADYLKRLAFFTLAESAAEQLPASKFNLKTSPPDLIDCVVDAGEAGQAAFFRALDCYATYRETIRRSNVRNIVTRKISFEIFQEAHEPPLTDLTDGI
ncbi:MAG: PIG-L family deacetylase [Bacteroidota bacterium]